jgi:NAD(P)-dependent dehydrogenase (short-subunit alcohol dehydrogenase family)
MTWRGWPPTPSRASVGAIPAFNNAGIAPRESGCKPIAELDVRDFDRLISIDLRGEFSCTKAELRHIVPAGRGSIVNTASVAGVVAEPGFAGYVAANHDVIGLTRAAAIEICAARYPGPCARPRLGAGAARPEVTDGARGFRTTVDGMTSFAIDVKGSRLLRRYR